MRYVVIGGAGAMGRIVARDLFEFARPVDEVVVADRREDDAASLVASLSRRRGRHPSLESNGVDVTSRRSLARVLSQADVVVNCVHHRMNLEVMEAALGARCHYLDLGGLFHTTRRQLELDPAFRARGLLAVLGMGAAPGITNVLAAHAASALDTVEEIHARVAGVDRTRYRHPPLLPLSYSLDTVLEELSVPAALFTDGQLEFVPAFSAAKPHRFPVPVGRQCPGYTLHSEVATLPNSYRCVGIREVSFKIAFAPELVERLGFLRQLGLTSTTPVRLGQGPVRPLELLGQLIAGQPASLPEGPLRQYEVVRSVVKGTRGKEKHTWVVDCATPGLPGWGIGVDIDTGAPASIVAQMIGEGGVRGAGVCAPEQLVPPEPFFQALQQRGMTVRARRRVGWDFCV